VITSLTSIQLGSDHRGGFFHFTVTQRGRANQWKFYLHEWPDAGAAARVQHSHLCDAMEGGK
jgi:hypothetical protein